MAEPATAEGPPRRRASWNLRNIVEDVAGRPIEELQDPARPPHPYLKSRPPPPPPSVPRRAASADEFDFDPVDRVYPPFVGASGRAFHGPEHEHHEETLAQHRTPGGPRAAGPSRRPERLYLHYLLLHLDRLGEPSLRYLRSAVDEEIAHREGLREPVPSRTAPPSAPPPLPPAPVAPSAGTPPLADDDLSDV